MGRRRCPETSGLTAQFTATCRARAESLSRCCNNEHVGLDFRRLDVELMRE